MRASSWAYAILLALGCVSAVAAEPPVPASPANRSERLSHALVLARIAQPEELVIGSALKQLDQGLVETLRADPELGRIEERYPGFLGRYYAAARPELERALRSRLPQLWQAMAQAYADEMTPAEIDSYLRFLQSPVGQKLQHHSTENFDASSLLQASVNSGLHPDPDSGRKELIAASNVAMLSSLATLNDAEKSEFVDFMGSAAGKAEQRAGKGVTAAIVGWMNAPDPEAEAKMGEIAVGVLTKMKSEKGSH
jgi:hypothetical protein